MTNENPIDDVEIVDAGVDEGEPRIFTQEELNAEMEKVLAKERRKLERDVAVKNAQNEPIIANIAPRPHISQFNDSASYADALAHWLVEERAAIQLHKETVGAYREREDAAFEKYDDFEAVAYDRNLQISDAMAQAIQTADNGPDILYHLGLNPAEAKRISKLPATTQAKEIGKLEAKLERNPPTPRSATVDADDADDSDTTSTRRSTVAAPAKKSYSTTDARSIETMTTSEWIAAERARQMKQLEAKRNGRR